MTTITYLLILFNIINIITSKDCIINNRTPENSWEKTLDDHLRCDNTLLINPSFNKSEIEVKIQFVLKYFTYDAVYEEFSTQTWLFLSWNDERIKWKPEDYHGIKETISPLVWIPNIRLFQTELNDMEIFSNEPCNIKSNGNVLCVSLKHHYIRCKANWRNWPYDMTKCNMDFGTWPEHVEKGVNVTLSFTSRALSLSNARESAEWTIVNYEQDENKNDEKQIRMVFTLERKPSAIVAIILYPSLIVTTLTILSLFLDARYYIRLGLTGLSLAIHFECLKEIGEYLPNDTSFAPTILLYLEGSLVMTVLAGLLTLFLRYLCRKGTEPYEWISRFNSIVLNGYAKYLISVQWGVEDNVAKGINFLKEWTKFACIFNSLCTIVMIISYICLLITYMPRPIVLVTANV